MTKLKSVVRYALVSLFSFLFIGSALADAPTPVAVWSGDFNVLQKTTPSGAVITLDKGSSNTLAADGSYIEIAGNLGIKFASTTAGVFGEGGNNGNKPGVTVLVKYTNLGQTSNSAVMISLLNGNGGAYDYLGALNNAGAARGIWNSSNKGYDWNNAQANVFPTDASAINTVALTYRHGGSPAGTSVYVNGELKKNWNGLQGQNFTPTAIGIGGPATDPTGSPAIYSATGMRVCAVAFFNKLLSADEIAAYKFPDYIYYKQGTDNGWGGNCNYANNLNGITLPETDATPVGTKVEVVKMEIAESPSGNTTDNRPTRIAITVDGKTTTSADFVSGGTISASGGNNPVKLTYNFPAGCVLTVGTPATIKWLKADGSEITSIRYAASNDTTGRFLTVNNGAGYSPIALLCGCRYIEPFIEPEGTTDENDIAPSFWYRFNGNLTSSGVRGFNTFNPGSTYTSDRAGQEGKALIVANGQTVNEPSPASPQSSLSGDGTKPTPFTISVIAKIAANGQNKVVLAEFSKKGNGDDIILAADPINKKILVCKDATTLIEQSIDDITTAFHTYVVTGDGSKVTLYVDGVANSTTSTTYPNTSRTACGIFRDGGGGYQTGFAAATGSAIDDYRVYCKKCLTAEQVAKIGTNMNQKEPEVTPTATISGDTTWGNLIWDPSLPTASDKVELTVSANAKLTIDNNTAFKSLKLIGARNLTIAGITAANVALLSKISIGSFSGKLTFEIDASAGFTADDTLKNLIKTAGTQYTFVFKSTVANKGATINYGTSVNATLNSHIVFNGGTHAFTFGQSVETKDFGANASNENPTVWVKGGATLNFTGKDLTGWNGTANANGVIRVDNGATLNFLADGRNTVYYRQRLCLEPGAKVTFPDTTGANDNKPVVRFLGGTAESNEVIYVLPPTGTATTATISGNIFFAKDNTHGFGVFVDSNSRLKWVGNMLVYDDNDDKAIVKRGAGVLEYSGTMDGVVQVAAGAIGGNGAFRKLTLGANGALDLNNGAPTITGSLSTPVSKQLKLVIDKPTHMMSVIMLPAAADKTGWTARVNGRETENELIVEGNTLKLKWKEPPTIEVDIDDITIEPTSDWNGGTVKIDVSSLEEGDYEGDIAYHLKFGDKTVDGLVENNIATFMLDDYFTAGKIYRGTFELEYGDAGDTIEAAEVIVYEGELTYKNKDDLWVNETPTTLGRTGTYKPDAGVSVDGDVIKIDTQDEVTFSPTLDPDYVDKCDSELTMTIFASEAVDDDLTVEEGAQAGVMIISDGNGGVEFRFIGCDENNEWQWMRGPAADLNTDYEVTISFHYAKDASDTDSVTYTIDVFTGSYTYAHRPNTADKVTEIIFADGTRFKSLIGTCQIEVADPVAQGIKPGEKQEIVADNDDEAQEKAAKIPVMIPEDDADVIAALDTDEAKAKYKALFKVIAMKKNGSYTAEVVFTELAEKIIKDDEENILTEVVEALGSLLGGDDDTLENIKGQPGLYYGIASDGELVNMGEATPEEWVIANKDGDIIGLKVKKTASAKQGFYKVICTPTKPAK